MFSIRAAAINLLQSHKFAVNPGKRFFVAAKTKRDNFKQPVVKSALFKAKTVRQNRSIFDKLKNETITLNEAVEMVYDFKDISQETDDVFKSLTSNTFKIEQIVKLLRGHFYKRYDGTAEKNDDEERMIPVVVSRIYN